MAKLGFFWSRALELEAGPLRIPGDSKHVEVRFRVNRLWMPFAIASMMGGPWWWAVGGFFFGIWHFWVRRC
jgi:hypothetical protein